MRPPTHRRINHEVWVSILPPTYTIRTLPVHGRMKVRDATQTPSPTVRTSNAVDVPPRRATSTYKTTDEPPWSSLSRLARCRIVGVKLSLCLVMCLVLFVYLCALGLVSASFGLLGSRGLGNWIKNSELIRDPLSAVMVGMLLSALLQSSTTMTTILVSMVAADIITVHRAIPVMIGSELGSTLANVFVSLVHAGDRDKFLRAFAAATLGDIFNVCCLAILLPMELMFSFIERISWLIVDPLITEKGIEFQTIDKLTGPVNDLILQIDEPGLREAIADDHFEPGHSFVLRCAFQNGSRIFPCPYRHVFAYSSWRDTAIGACVLLGSVVVLIACLALIVALVNTILSGRLANVMRRLLEKQLPGRFRALTGYLLMLVGSCVTVVLQSSNVFSSSLTSLAGSGVVPLVTIYPLMLGSNIGATFSGVLAALSADGSRFEKTLHMAVCQVLYNIAGTVLFYVIPTMRKLPLHLSMRLGQITADHRWFALVYLFILFVVIPAICIGLSLLPPVITQLVFILLLLFLLLIVGINLLQKFSPQYLPSALHSWEWVPVGLRSLTPYDAWGNSVIRQTPLLNRIFKEEEADMSMQSVDRLVKLSRHTQV